MCNELSEIVTVEPKTSETLEPVLKCTHVYMRNDYVRAISFMFIHTH